VSKIEQHMKVRCGEEEAHFSVQSASAKGTLSLPP
jgi:hypothetical protein